MRRGGPRRYLYNQGIVPPGPHPPLAQLSCFDPWSCRERHARQAGTGHRRHARRDASRTPGPSSTPRSARSSAGTSAPTPARRSGSRRPRSFKFDPLKDVKGFDDLKKFGLFEDDWLRGGPVQPLGAEGAARTSRATSSRPAAPPASPRAASSSTTSGSTTRCSATRCRTSSSRRARNWLMLGPSGPRRLRLAVEHLCPVPRRHLLLHRPRPALGRQAHQEGLDGAPARRTRSTASTRR